MKFHPDVLAAHAQFGGDLESMQKCYAYPSLLETLREAHQALMHYEWYANPKSKWARPENTTLRDTIEAALSGRAALRDAEEGGE